jgi:hypothetical protein
MSDTDGNLRTLSDFPSWLIEELESYDIEPEEFIDQLNTVDGKRSNIVIDGILENEWISTRQLREDYGYEHAPRAARDVREQGIPLKTIYPPEYDDRVGAYKFDLEAFGKDRHQGRLNFTDRFKNALIEEYGEKCLVCNHEFDSQYLQIDHRVPYAVGGDPREKRDVSDYMLVCRSCNRTKSWQCEHCENGTQVKDEGVCQDCYWARPEDYSHVAMRDERRLDIVWDGEQTEAFESMNKKAAELGMSLQEFVKSMIFAKTQE